MKVKIVASRPAEGQDSIDGHVGRILEAEPVPKEDKRERQKVWVDLEGDGLRSILQWDEYDIVE